MNKYLIGINGMKCGMCEVHIEETIDKALKVKRVKANRNKNLLTVITEDNLSVDDFHRILDDTGYQITSFERTLPMKRLFGWR